MGKNASVSVQKSPGKAPARSVVPSGGSTNPTIYTGGKNSSVIPAGPCNLPK